MMLRISFSVVGFLLPTKFGNHVQLALLPRCC